MTIERFLERQLPELQAILRGCELSEESARRRMVQAKLEHRRAKVQRQSAQRRLRLARKHSQPAEGER